MEAGIANAVGSLERVGNTIGAYATGTGAFTVTARWKGEYAGGGGRPNEEGRFYMSLSNSNSIFGNSETVTPLSTSCSFLIRF